MTIDRLIINSPHEEPTRHWCYDRKVRLFDLVENRRPAGYVVASGNKVLKKTLLNLVVHFNIDKAV
ncbi:MAG: hypothetical protein OXE78_07415 [Gammaproteobacteria bacterium]|nr:hypothetical protein [Gammaproteobacteria bacterium]MCY4356254.1 hypothetical protein [Gammaproteobacteria bacterium]